MIPGPRSPGKHQIHLHLEGKQKTPSERHRHPLHGRGRRGQKPRSSTRDADAGLPVASPPRTPATHTARQLRVPIVGTRRSFPSLTMTPFLSEEKLTTSRVRPGLGAPRVRADSGLRGPAGRRRTGPPGPLPTSRSETWTDKRSGPRSQPRGPGTGRRGEGREAAQLPPPARLPGPHRGRAELRPRPPGWGCRGRRGRRGLQGRGPEFGRRASAPQRSSPLVARARTPSRTPDEPAKASEMPYLPGRRAQTPARPESPPRLPPKTSRPGGEVGEKSGGSSGGRS